MNCTLDKQTGIRARPKVTNGMLDYVGHDSQALLWIRGGNTGVWTPDAVTVRRVRAFFFYLSLNIVISQSRVSENKRFKKKSSLTIWSNYDELRDSNNESEVKTRPQRRTRSVEQTILHVCASQSVLLPMFFYVLRFFHGLRQNRQTKSVPSTLVAFRILSPLNHAACKPRPKIPDSRQQFVSCEDYRRCTVRRRWEAERGVIHDETTCWDNNTSRNRSQRRQSVGVKELQTVAWLEAWIDISEYRCRYVLQ